MDPTAFHASCALGHIPVVMLTNYDDEETINECLDSGAFGFILKSDLNLQKLMETIDSITESLDASLERLPSPPLKGK